MKEEKGKDCKDCAYKQNNNDGGFCYMWEKKPENCHYFKYMKEKNK